MLTENPPTILLIGGPTLSLTTGGVGEEYLKHYRKSVLRSAVEDGTEYILVFVGFYK